MSSKRKNSDELNLTSSNFNPLKALYEPENVTIPHPSAPILDNISSFIETPEGIFPKPKREPKIKPEQTKSSDSKREQTSSSQEDLRREAEERIKSTRNVISRMDTVKGPLTFIKKCLDEKLRVKVYTRGAVNVRGFCLGFIVAFDKHWNLVLKDVFETWTRKKKKKVPFLGPVANEETRENFDEKESDILSSKFKVDDRYNRPKEPSNKSKVIVRKRLKRREICERHVDQLLIRGEQIVIVTLEPV